MKKLFLSIIFAIMLICTLFAGCKDKTYTVTAISRIPDDNPSATTIAELLLNQTITIKVKENSIIGAISLPADTSGYIFRGWFTDESYTYQWNTATDIVIGDMTLYAKWEKITK